MVHEKQRPPDRKMTQYYYDNRTKILKQRKTKYKESKKSKIKSPSLNRLDKIKNI